MVTVLYLIEAAAEVLIDAANVRTPSLSLATGETEATKRSRAEEAQLLSEREVVAGLMDAMACYGW